MAAQLPTYTSEDVRRLVQAALDVLFSDSNPSLERGSLEGLADTLPKLQHALRPFVDRIEP